MRWLRSLRRCPPITPPGDVCEAQNLGDTMPMSPDSPNSSPSETISFEGLVLSDDIGTPTPGGAELEIGFEVNPDPSGEVTPTSASRRSSQRETEDELRARLTYKEKASCTMYRVNLLSANFGECKCGLPRASHSDEALKENAQQKGGAGRTTRRDENELRRKFVQREFVACTRYEVDMSPGVQYGVCKCGKPRAEHSDRALQGSKPELKAKRSEEAVIAQMKTRAAAADAAATTHAPPTRGLRPQPRAHRDHSPQQSPLNKSSLMRARRVMA